MDYDVVIAGGGISGLAAAYTLQQAGLSSVVFEAETFPGGRMSSETVGGCIIDKGAYTIPAFYNALKGMLKELGMGGQLVKTPSTSATYLDGKAYNIKVGSPTDFLKFRLLSPRNKLNLMKLALYAKTLGTALDLSNPTPRSLELEKETASDYLLENYNPEILERIAYPIFCEIFLGNPEFNSKLAFLATLANLTLFSICAFENGMGSLPEYLANSLEVRLGTPVAEITKRPGCEGYEVCAGTNGEVVVTCGAVILALPLPRAADMLVEAPADLKAAFKAISYNPSIVTAWGLETPMGDGAMINNFLRKESKVLGTVVFDDLKGATRVPPGKGLVTVILGETASRDLFDAPEAQIQDEVLTEMATVFPSFAQRVSFTRTYRWKHAAIQLPPGALAAKRALADTIAKTFNGIYVASDSLHKTGVETSLRTGIMAARQAINFP